MIAINLRTLCVALGFLAVVMKDGKLQKNNAQRALAIALLMEAFCAAHGTEAAPLPVDAIHDPRDMPEKP